MACGDCISCGSKSTDGCKNNGCASGGCNRLNTYDWISVMDLTDSENFDLVEVSFKNGARKSFCKNMSYNQAVTGDWVVVNNGTGQDLGRVSLSGELVRLQMKKKNVSDKGDFHKIIRVAGERDMERMQELREKEKPLMVRARVISRTLGLDMKIGDVELQGDGRKATFYYTADGRVDFRELIRHYAKEFKVKIEMRQIGTRQESARIGGVGSCGRELCCSTWLSDFQTVTTSAARYQNLAINQSKLSGQCGRLKCCLNYELDTYMEALSHFPKNADKLYSKAGTAQLLKVDIFKQLMYYVYQTDTQRGKICILAPEKVAQILEMNARKELPDDLSLMQTYKTYSSDEEPEVDFEGDVTGVIELPAEKSKSRGRKRRNYGRKNKNRSRDRKN